jgi:hypothetical protein
MTTYAVFEPPMGGDPVTSADATRFVPDRFHWFAFLLPAVFCLVNRLWLGLFVYCVAVGAIVALANVLPDLAAPNLFGLSLLMGFEAPELIGRNLARRGFRPAGYVFGATLEEAERRFFDQVRVPVAVPVSAIGPMPPRATGPAVIGFGT